MRFSWWFCQGLLILTGVCSAVSSMWAPALLGKPSVEHCFPGDDIHKHAAMLPKCKDVKEIWIGLLEIRRHHMLHIYKIQVKFSLDPNVSRILLSVYTCSVRMQGNQAASVKVLATLACRAGLYVTLDTVL